MKDKWDKRFLELAEHISTWSKDRSTKVGVVIVDDEKRVVSIGYNGFPRGCNDDVECRHERPAKYMYTEHSERNAIYNAARLGISTKGKIMYCTLFPCADCARAIIQSGIKELNVIQPGPEDGRWSDSQKVAIELFDEAKIKLNYFKKS